MKSRITIVFAMLLLSFSATAEMQTYSEVYELAASDVRLPQSDAGTIAFKRCSECETQTEQLSGNTVWKLNGRGTSLVKFRAAMAGIIKRDRQLVTITQRVEDEDITEVAMWVR